MSRFRGFTITPEALEQARGLGFTGDVAAQLKELARFAAPFTHSDGNRRNGEWLMLIEEGAGMRTGVGEVGELEELPEPDGVVGDGDAGHGTQCGAAHARTSDVVRPLIRDGHRLCS